MSGEADPPDEHARRGDSAADVPPALKRQGQSTLSLDPESGASSDGQSGEALPRLARGEQLGGRFTVLRFVARGGMGAVYEATDVMLRARVALKVLQGKITADAAAMERFRREVLLARRVGHPNVCRVYELFQTTTPAGAPIHFLTMEFLEGETLAARIAREGRMRTTESLALVQQMCDGLAAAHAEGVIHRDFKSSNVMLVHRAEDSVPASADATRVAITDFGIARVFEPGGPEAGGGGLTSGASIVGTPEYMAPEQVTGSAVSPATDIYALGVVLYEMVTGRLPFSGANRLATAARRINEPAPRPELAAPGLDPRWNQAILRCLERDPRRRFQSPADVVDALTGSAPAATQPSIAVLAFVDMSPERDQEYFSDGVAQEIIGALAQVPGLHVAARSSSFSFKGKNEDLRLVGQKLDVAHVLEGSVRKAGSHLRVTAQLVNAASGYQLWSQTFDRELADVFAVQDEIAHAVVSALKVRVLRDAEGAGRRVTTPEAYTHYLLGLQLENTGSTSGLAGAVEEYRRAIALDRTYAPAHARLAWAIVFYTNTSSTPELQMRREALAEAELAVELDPNRGDGYVARGIVRCLVNRDWWAGREDFERAVTLSPGDARTRTWLGVSRAAFGQLPSAIAAGQAALELDPFSPEVRFRLASFYNAEGNYPQAREILRKALEIAPQDGMVLRELAFTELLDGHPAEALALSRMNDQAWARSLGSALAYFSLGNSQQSQADLDHLIANSNGAHYQIAQVHAWRGERDLAFEWLEEARARNDPGIVYLKYDPFMRPLRGDPRFAALLQNVKLPPD